MNYSIEVSKKAKKGLNTAASAFLASVGYEKIENNEEEVDRKACIFPDFCRKNRGEDC